MQLGNELHNATDGKDHKATIGLAIAAITLLFVFLGYKHSQTTAASVVGNPSTDTGSVDSGAVPDASGVSSGDLGNASTPGDFLSTIESEFAQQNQAIAAALNNASTPVAGSQTPVTNTATGAPNYLSGLPADEQFVANAYENLLGRWPSLSDFAANGGAAYWTKIYDQKGKGAAAVLSGIASSPEGVAHTQATTKTNSTPPAASGSVSPGAIVASQPAGTLNGTAIRAAGQ